MHVLRVPDEFEQANHSRIKALSVNLTGQRERLRSLLDERNFEDIKKHLEDTPPESFDVSTPLLVILIQGCIFRLTCSHPELTKDHVLTSAYVKIFRTVTRNAVKRVFEGKEIVFDFP